VAGFVTIFFGPVQKKNSGFVTGVFYTTKLVLSLEFPRQKKNTCSLVDNIFLLLKAKRKMTLFNTYFTTENEYFVYKKTTEN
jgi:hypothetical protein